jgi:hypothetical protein
MTRLLETTSTVRTALFIETVQTVAGIVKATEAILQSLAVLDNEAKDIVEKAKKFYPPSKKYLKKIIYSPP